MTIQGKMHLIQLHVVYVGNFLGQEEINDKCMKTMHTDFTVHAKKHVRHNIHYNSLIVMKTGISL